MITEKKFCKKCGQKIEVSNNPLASIVGGKQNFVELNDGIYCIDCGREEVKRRRAKK